MSECPVLFDNPWKGGGVNVPNELCWLSPQEIGFYSAGDLPLLPNQVRARALKARIRHGVDLTPPANSKEFPHAFQSWGVAEVIEVGSAVDRFKPGDRVYGWMKIADRQVLDSNQLRSIEEFSNRSEFATFIDAGAAALRAVHAAGILFGDRVAIWGMGTVGLMAVQYALLNGALEIIAVDPLEPRLKIARKLGAHQILSSWQDENEPIDAAIDCSGAADVRGLIERIAANSGVRIQKEDCRKNARDLYTRVEYSLVAKRAIVWPIVSHIIPFEQTPAVCAQIQNNRSEYIQVLVAFDSEFRMTLRYS
jgi:hypothetical protein